MYYQNHISVRFLTASSGAYCHRPEYMIVELAPSAASRLILGIVYRPPKVGYFYEFESAFSALVTNYKHAVIVGDFNSNLLTDNHDSIYLNNLFLRLGFSIVPYSATHTATSHTWLDVFSVDSLDKISTLGQIPVPFLSGHDLIFIEYTISTGEGRMSDFEYRDIARVNVDALCGDLAASDWNCFRACSPFSLASVASADAVHH